MVKIKLNKSLILNNVIGKKRQKKLKELVTKKPRHVGLREACCKLGLVFFLVIRGGKRRLSSIE